MCSRETDLERPYPRVATLEPADIDTTGVTFKGRFTYVNANFTITKLGFIWSDKPEALIEEAERVELQSLSDVFTYRCTAPFDSGQRYYVRAYIVAGGYTMYGMAFPFVSQGGGRCQIDSVYPLQWTWGDTLVVYGSNFSYQNGHNIISINGDEFESEKSTDKILKIALNNELNDNTISVSIECNSSRYSYPIQLLRKPASVAEIIPYYCRAGDTLQLSGEGFYPLHPGLNQVFVGTRLATILDCSATHLRCILPGDLASGSTTLSLVVNNLPATGANAVLVAEPE